MGSRLAAAVAVIAGGAVVAAVASSCSSGSKATADASAEGGDDAIGSDGDDAGAEAAGDAGDESVLQGACEPIDGSCDLVTQDCPAGKQCSQVQNFSGTSFTECTATNSHQHIDKGYPCCPRDPTDQCLPGLQCIGNDCAPDAGPGPGGEGRCTPACCRGDDTPCGASPEGFPGVCNEQIVDPSTKQTLYWVCIYSQPCKPFGVQPCKQGEGCYLSGDMSGGAECAETYNNGLPGIKEGQPCGSVNSCVDGTDCLGAGDGGAFVCTMVCYTGKGNPPFNPSTLKGGPGGGGCDMGKSCKPLNGYPAWLGVCL
jgi:hypothetical protein